MLLLVFRSPLPARRLIRGGLFLAAKPFRGAAAIFCSSRNQGFTLRVFTHPALLMKLPRLLSVSLLGLAGLLSIPSALALLAPQDNWRGYSNSSWSFPGYPRALAVAPNDELYVAVENPYSFSPAGPTTIEIFTRTGAPVRRFVELSTVEHVLSMAIGKSGTVFVFSTDRQVRAYSPDGTLAAQWGGSGTGMGLFGNISISAAPATSLAVDSSENVYVADVGNRLVQKFSATGAFQTQWGGSGTLAGQFGSSGPILVGVTPQDRVIVASSVSGRILQMFDANGSLVSTSGSSGSLPSTNALLAVLPDGLTLLARGATTINVHDNNLAAIGGVSTPIGTKSGLATNRHGDFFLAFPASVSGVYTGTVTRYERGYSVDNPPAGSTPPQPALLSTEQRPSTPYVDIDYTVIDPDDATAHVALLGFVDGGNDLNKVLKLSSFVEGTAANVGIGQPTNQVRRVTWNAAADWSVEFGNVQIEILAQDARGLLPVHWITLPAQGSEPAIAISRRPVLDAELMNLWYWLIATGDAGIALNNGQITGIGGAYAGQILADTSGSSSSTTAEGRAFLYARCGVRALTETERARAAAGQFGFTELSELSVARLTDGTP